MATPTADDRATTKHHKPTHHNHRQHYHNHETEEHPLIPGLPDHVAQLCLSLVQPTLLYSVCRAWRRLIYSPSFPPFLSLYTLLSSPKTAGRDDDNGDDGGENGSSNAIRYFTYDPISSKWDPLPPPPPDPPLRLLLQHPSFISRHLPVQSVSVAGRLILLAATTHNFAPALSRPLVFNPISRTWSFGPPLSAPRRWCAVGTTRTAIYVASGIGSQFSTDVARSMEKWDLKNAENKTIVNYPIFSSNTKTTTGTGACCWRWEKMKAMKDGRFSRDAITAVGWRGKLCMVNVEGDAAKEGAIYDVERNEWMEMPDGMVAGWKGPAVAVDEEVMYVVDEARGVLKKYDDRRDDWVDVIGSDRLRGATHIASGGGKICVVRGGSGGGGRGGVVVVDVVAVPVRLVVVDVPVGFEAVAVHVLPRMCRPDFPQSTSRT